MLQLTRMAQPLLVLPRVSTAGIRLGLFLEDAWFLSPSRLSVVGELRPWSGFVERRMLWLRLILRWRQQDIGGRLRS